jgi:hypothetical protein
MIFQKIPKANRSEGAIMILAIVLCAALLTLMTGLVGYWMTQIGHHRQSIARAKALSIAEAGIEMAIWKLNNQPGYVGENGTAYGEGTYDISLTAPTGTTRIITADSYIPNASAPKAKRTIQLTLTVGTTNVGFNYGVHVGNGGIEMSNISTINGNVYANGYIKGTNSARIAGTAIVAGTGYIDGMDIDSNAQAHTIRGGSDIGGNATASVIQNSTVGGNVLADSISSCTISGSATYDTRSSCTVSGTATSPNPNSYNVPPVVPMPVTEEQIDGWEDEALNGGTIGTQSFSSGTRNLGPAKINGDLIISGTAEVVVTGTLWITGELRMSQSSIIRLSPLYGSLGGVVVVGEDENSTKGYIEMLNSSSAFGSGTAGSYIMLLSQREGTSTVAINNNNTGTSAILYAGEGTIELSNSGTMKEITAERLIISNSATVSYETGLANSAFASGPTGGWEVLEGTWQLLQ